MADYLKTALKQLKHNKQLLWFLIYPTLCCFMVFLMLSLWEKFTRNPTVITFEGVVHPVTAIPFPGISLCNLNKISKKKVQTLAEEMARKTDVNYTKILQSMRHLGNLVDSNYDDTQRDEIELLQTLIDSLNLKITSLMQMLTTPCEQLLQECYWKGTTVNCSKLFHLTLTFEGFCCTFNYYRTHHHFHGDPGLDSGLSVLVNNDPEDYMYTILPSVGLNVHVFVPGDYPDRHSGNLIENLANMGTENFIEILPMTTRSVRDVMDYPRDKRQCLFDVEQRTRFGVYSQSDCFVDCRVKSMMTLCGCVPFTIPGGGDDDTICTLSDLHCLAKYKSKWSSVAPREAIAVNIKEQEDGLYCGQLCYPSCEGTLYSTSTSTVKIRNSTLDNVTVVHMYYAQRYHNLYKQDVVYYWFEILSNFGGIVGIVMGLSVLSLVATVIRFSKMLVQLLFE